MKILLILIYIIIKLIAEIKSLTCTNSGVNLTLDPTNINAIGIELTTGYCLQENEQKTYGAQYCASTFCILN